MKETSIYQETNKCLTIGDVMREKHCHFRVHRNLKSLILLILHFIEILQLVGINSNNSYNTSHKCYSKKPSIKGNHVFSSEVHALSRKTPEVELKPCAKVSMVQKCQSFARDPNFKRKIKKQREREKKD